MKYFTIVSIFFLLFTGCSSKKPEPSLADKVAELRQLLKSQQDLNIGGENVTITLEDDNKTVNFSFNNNILFDFNQYKIKTEFENSLGIATNFLIKNPTFGVIVEGHTDSIGDKKYNQELSEKRALAVASILIEQGIASERISSIGYGEESPKVDNDTEEGRNQNRRAEIRVRENIQDIISESSSSSKSSSKTLSSSSNYNSKREDKEKSQKKKELEEEIARQCKYAKPASSVTKALSAWAGFLQGLNDGDISGHINANLNAANNTAWIKGVNYACP